MTCKQSSYFAACKAVYGIEMQHYGMKMCFVYVYVIDIHHRSGF